jgi:hypothetical protein
MNSHAVNPTKEVRAANIIRLVIVENTPMLSIKLKIAAVMAVAARKLGNVPSKNVPTLPNSYGTFDLISLIAKTPNIEAKHTVANAKRYFTCVNLISRTFTARV